MALTFRPQETRLEQQLLERRLKMDTYTSFYKGLFDSFPDNVLHVIYKTLGEYEGRVIVYVSYYDTFTERVPINQLFYRSTGTSRDLDNAGVWFPMSTFEFTLTGYRIGKLEDYYLNDDARRLDDYVKGAKRHPSDDINAYGRYLQYDLAVVGKWLMTHWTSPPELRTVNPNSKLFQVESANTLRLTFLRPMDVKFFLDMYVDPRNVSVEVRDNDIQLTFPSHHDMMRFYDRSDVFNYTMLRIKKVRFL